jgi:HEPN domain-containing protein
MRNDIALKWYKQSLHDLEIAEKNISIEGYDVAAFLSHQAVEKLLKSIFAFLGKKIPKTHYIDELAKKLSLDDEVIDEILDLTADYIFSRYPDVSEHLPYEEYDEEIATEKVELAKRVFSAVLKKFPGLKEINK